MTPMDIEAILERLPDRYPLLLVDRVLDLEPGRRGVGLKNVTFNEEYFQGHFPSHPVMPGVLILEALSQVGRLVIASGPGAPEAARLRVAAVQEARFRRPVVPGDALLLEVTVEGDGEGRWRLRGEARVGETLAAEAGMLALEDPAA